MKVQEAKAKPQENGVFDKLELALGKYRFYIVGACLALTIIFSYLLYDARLSFATDDAEYVVRASNFVHKGNYPSYQGPLYPLLLSLLMLVFGMNLTILKIFSALCLLGQVWFFYKAFYAKVPALPLFATLSIIAVNTYFIYFGSYTFNEAFLMFVQAAGFLFFLKLIQKVSENREGAIPWGPWLMFGLFCFLLSITKNILILIVPVSILFFLLYKQWKNALLAPGSFLVFQIPYLLFTRLVLHDKPSSQWDQIMRKSFYDPSQGYEDFSGFVDRFFSNFGSFFSYHFFSVLHLRPAAEHPDSSVILGLIFVLLVVFSIVTLRKKNPSALFGLLYGLAVSLVICVALQTVWAEQERLVLPYIPYILVAFLTAGWFWIKDNKRTFLKPLLIGFTALLVLLQLPDAFSKSGKNSRALRRYMKGDNTYGFPPQVQDFLDMAKWIGQNVSDSAVIATAKPSEAFIYAGGKNFVRIDKPAPGESADSILARLRKRKVTHLLFDQTGFGSTIPLTLQAIQKTYPQKLDLQYQIGEGEAATMLIKIDYDKK